MYCNKIILRARQPTGHFWDFPMILRNLSPSCSHVVKNQGLQTSYWHNGHIVLLKHSLSRELPFILILALRQLGQPGISLCGHHCLLSAYFGWFPRHQRIFSLCHLFLFPSSSTVSVWRICVCIYLFMHCVIFCRKKSQQHKHRQCKWKC